MRSHVVHWLASFLPANVAQALAPSWFTCVGLAGVATLIVMLAVARKNRIDSGAIASIVLWAYVAAVVAGIVVPAFIDMIEQKLSTGHVHIRWAGMTSFWGYLAGFVAIVIVCREHRISLGKFGDLATAPLGITLVFARLGCFLAGCDYGKVTSLPWAVRFPSGSPAWHAHVNAGLVPASRPESLPVHPTQLYEAFLGIVIVAVAVWAARQKWARAAEGRVALVGIAVYAVGRIVIEMFRGDVGRGIYAGMSSGQIFSLCVLAVLALVVFRKRVMPVVAAAAAMLLVVAGSESHAHAQGKQTTPTAKQPAPPQPAPQQQPAPQPQQQPAPQPQQQPAPQQYPQQQPYPQQYPQQVPQQPYPQQPYPQQYPQQYPQPYPGQPYPQQPYPGQPYPQPCPQQPCPYPTPYPYPNGYPQYPQQPAQPSKPRNLHLEVGLLGGVAMPINRRPEQVATLAGPSLSVGYMFNRAGIWLDFDSLGNRDATHGTFLLSGSMMSEVRDHLSIGARVGLGATLVNFDEPAFRDVSGTSFRFEAITDYEISDSWSLWARPFSFDILTAQELGGPITTWQIRAGIAYRFDGKAKALAEQEAAHPNPAPPAPAPAAPIDPTTPTAPATPAPAAPMTPAAPTTVTPPAKEATR